MEKFELGPIDSMPADVTAGDIKISQVLVMPDGTRSMVVGLRYLDIEEVPYHDLMVYLQNGQEIRFDTLDAVTVDSVPCGHVQKETQQMIKALAEAKGLPLPLGDALIHGITNEQRARLVVNTLLDLA